MSAPLSVVHSMKGRCASALDAVRSSEVELGFVESLVIGMTIAVSTLARLTVGVSVPWNGERELGFACQFEVVAVQAEER